MSNKALNSKFALQDTKVNLKKKFNDQGQRTRGLLSGDQWYCQQAFRSVWVVSGLASCDQ